MANFKLRVLLEKKKPTVFKETQSKCKEYISMSMSVNNGTRALSISHCLKHTYKNGHKDNPSVNERLVADEDGAGITLLRLSCKFITHSVQFSTRLNSRSALLCHQSRSLTSLPYTLTRGLVSLAPSDTST